MRVFYDHQVTSLQDAGGVSRYYFELVRALQRTGAVEAEMMLGLNRSVLPFAQLRPGVRVLSYGTTIRPGYVRYALNEALTAVRAPSRGRFDVYHATYQRVLPCISNKTVVVTHHDSTPGRFPHLFRNAEAIHERLQRVYARADRVICISEASRADLLHDYDVQPERTEVIHHGFTRLAADPEDALRGLLPERPYLLYVGARHSYKNFPIVLEALARQRDGDVHLVVAGGGPLRALETRAIERLRLGTRVHLIPAVSDEQLAAAYRGAAMFVYPSLYEGFGFPPLEAMDAGCPALVSRTSALPEICGDAAFYFDPDSVDELAGLIERLLADEAVRFSKRDAGFSRVRQYTWEKTAARTLAAYRAAMDGRRR